MSIRLVMTTESVMMEGSVTRFFRAQIWDGVKHPYRLDSTNLYDTEAEAREAGEELASLYGGERENFATVLLGYISYEGMVELQEHRGAGNLCGVIMNRPDDYHVVPVYTKVNDSFHNRAVGG